ncbi:VOC family protein [Rhizorhabdus wittichii]|jgi:catechol 2,3-dioxygenase-like lactoylglutathione lyase family enzyme|uniref:Glyoxalase/bleomycin resistance protein/dioxygenase n=2 Tax=Rhizorhabdus wittichii TaxID=160791 RepID=A0A9J9HAU0_RHIWR|nr:VOC family protein [Rhizorhabdus wittichii]ABQ68221.1 Glyoxalase/bleomycin resistance protein/dioxygenase [Rhizorhabdus wittichii RW1]QTH21348.1 VOC family protein [Rhizorhabdus wittichii]
MPGISYATIGSNDLEKAKAFYDELLGSIGWGTAMDLPTGGRIYGDGASMFGVLSPYDGGAASAGNGTMIGFSFDSVEALARFHARALALGATNEGDPGERMPGACFGYFRDPDGNKLCAYRIG